MRLLNRRLRREQCRLHRLLLAGRTPIDQAGATPTFSLLFDMNKVFERFVAAILRRYVAPGLPAVAIFEAKSMTSSPADPPAQSDPPPRVHGVNADQTLTVP